MQKTMLAALAALMLPAAVQAADSTFAAEAAKDLRERARLPEWTQALPPGALDPVLAKRTPTRQSLGGPQGAAPILSVWTSTISAQPGQAVDLFAQLSAVTPDMNKLTDLLRANREKPTGTISAQVLDEAGAVLADLRYADDGKGADARAADGVYSARVVLPASRAPALGTAQSLMVQVRAALADGQVRDAVGGFQYSNPGATLTGAFKEAYRQGNLVLQAEANVLAPGRYHLSGTLSDLLGAPLAAAQSAQTFSTPGKYWMDLPYYGLALQDRGLTGRLRLSSVTLTSVNAMPNALGPVLQNAYLTQALNLAVLTRLPFNNPDMLEAARRLEASTITR
ncbi:MAG TPA: choice-of-anchor X domain-containing protein [Solimonas sp.]|nr:choice-of-anchor X domain-containing protein [Solimonas sp.]